MRTRSGVVVTRIAAATAVAVATLIAGIEAKATGINVFDNTLSDWGVTIADNNGSNVGVCKTQNCNPAFGPTGPVTAFSYRSEDSNDFAPLIGTPGNTGYVGPDPFNY